MLNLVRNAQRDSIAAYYLNTPDRGWRTRETSRALDLACHLAHEAGHTLAEIGRVLDVGRERVRQRIARERFRVAHEAFVKALCEETEFRLRSERRATALVGFLSELAEGYSPTASHGEWIRGVVKKDVRAAIERIRGGT